jgi:hypothetical protein
MDGTTWNTYIDPDSEDETLHRGKVINLNKDETVYFRATLGDVPENPNLNGFGYYDEEWGGAAKYHYFIMEGSIKADGNIQFLLENTGTKTEVPAYCYYGMFKSCTALTQAPALPATTLANNCYAEMFYNCTSLTQAPALPATTLASWCYHAMFSKCTSLTQAPELPVMTLANCCYYSMFSKCTSLTQAPALPATTLASSCYGNMFIGCTSLTQAPALPATTLARSCYGNMFSGCSSLTQASVLPATTLDEWCYMSMFEGCTNINSISVNFSDWNTDSNATNRWVENVSSSGTFTCPADLPEVFGEDRIPTGWTVVRK